MKEFIIDQNINLCLTSVTFCCVCGMARMGLIYLTKTCMYEIVTCQTNTGYKVCETNDKCLISLDIVSLSQCFPILLCLVHQNPIPFNN